MKKIILLVWVCVLCLLLVSCGTRTDTDTETQTETQTETNTETNTDFSVDAAHTSLPLMGWSSWNCFATNISESIIREQAEALVALGLDRLGYTFVNIDDGFQRGRDETGNLIIHLERFPNGLAGLVSDIHTLGLYAGIYSDAGDLTCGYLYNGETENDDVGLYGHEEQDLRLFFCDLGFDFIKVDWGGGANLNLSRRAQYSKIGNIIDGLEAELGHTLRYNVCCWEYPGTWVRGVADSARIASDIKPNFDSILRILDQCTGLSVYQTATAINDPDMLVVGLGMTPAEDRSHFSMWCMLSAPLMIGTDLRNLSEDTLETLSNEALIAIDQDPDCRAAEPILTQGTVQIWKKRLANGDTVLAFLNRGDTEATANLAWSDLGYGAVTSVTDLWANDPVSADTVRVTLAAHETAVWHVVGTESSLPVSVVSLHLEDAEEQYDLSALGTVDWICNDEHSTLVGDRKTRPTARLNAVYSDTQTLVSGEETVYCWSDGTESPQGIGFTGLQVTGETSQFCISLPVGKTAETLTVLLDNEGDLCITVSDGSQVLAQYSRAESGTAVCSVTLAATTAQYISVSFTATQSVTFYAAALGTGETE